MKGLIKNDSDLLLAPWIQFDADLNIWDGIDRKYFFYLQHFFAYQATKFKPIELEFKESSNLFRLWGLTGSKIFKKSFLEKHQIIWDEEIFYCEDTDFLISVLCKEPKITLFNLDLYAYRVGHNSQLSSNVSDAKLEKIADGLPKILEKNIGNRYFVEIFANVFDIWIFSGIDFPNKKASRKYFQNSISVLRLLEKSSTKYIHHGLFGALKIGIRLLRLRQFKVIFKVILFAIESSIFLKFLSLKIHPVFQRLTMQSNTNT